jgi:hypothetical protein
VGGGTAGIAHDEQLLILARFTFQRKQKVFSKQIAIRFGFVVALCFEIPLRKHQIDGFLNVLGIVARKAIRMHCRSANKVGGYLNEFKPHVAISVSEITFSGA